MGQLEAVQPRWLQDRLEASVLWIRQSPPESRDFSPAYVRFPAPLPEPNALDREEPFSLF